jgi:hypothetical protein
MPIDPEGLANPGDEGNAKIAAANPCRSVAAGLTTALIAGAFNAKLPSWVPTAER